ncbi:MAG: bifunctional salicylyl-CoA 5-hydroxylase/oxidoreductase [Planctomycetota bacterium]
MKPMKIVCVGGGPAGLFFASLMKKKEPAHDVTVYERNPPDATFGFGVVFSDETLDHIEEADPETYAALSNAFARWDDVDVHFRGEVVRSGGHGFCGLGRRTLLQMLQRRAEGLGVKLLFEREVKDLGGFHDADLIIAADGVNSRIREAHPEAFRPSVHLGATRFAWLGTTLPLDAFTFFIRQDEHGLFTVHAYQFDGEMSTFIVECDEESWRGARLHEAGEEEALARLREVFREDLRGHPLVSNKFEWRRFPTVRCERWHHENVVLMGDAAHTAHFSIGSGTKLAMEDAIELAEALEANGDFDRAVVEYEAERMRDAERLQRAAKHSRVWFEQIRRHTRLPPHEFAYSMMTRSLRLDHESLRVRDPDYVAGVDRWFARGTLAAGVEPPPPPMFTPFRVRGLTLRNRVVVSPMCMYCADGGLVGDFHYVHLGARALGGAALVLTEMTCVDRDARITPGCAGLYRPEHAAAWKRVVDFVHRHTPAAIGIQLGHAGRKGATRVMREGMDEPLEEGAWPLLSASPIPWFAGRSQVPREMDRRDMERVRDAFVAAARMAEECGFDWLEVHMAHGYLLASFLSPLTNRRRDAYGGSPAARMRYPLEVFGAVREVWPEHRPMSVRFSAADWAEGGLRLEEAAAFAREVAAVGCDVLNVSTGGTVPVAEPEYGTMWQVPFSEWVRREAGVATITAGGIHRPGHANTIVASGRADLVALARPHLRDPHWTLRAAAALDHYDQRWPRQYSAVQHEPREYTPPPRKRRPQRGRRVR